jgi:hypothetical protein
MPAAIISVSRQDDTKRQSKETARPAFGHPTVRVWMPSNKNLLGLWKVFLDFSLFIGGKKSVLICEICG